MPDSNLAKLQQISDLRKRRNERLLVEAKSALSEAEKERILAEQENLREQARLNEAKIASYNDPASEQAWIWQAATQKSRQTAEYLYEQKTEAALECQNGVKQAAQAFMKARIKVENLETHNRQLKKTAERKQEDKLAEEQQAARPNGFRLG